MSGDAFSRYQSWREQLAAAPASAGGVLELVGDILRRSERLGTEGVEGALRRLSRSQVEEWLRSLKTSALQSSLLRAAEESVEYALGEGGEEGDLWRASALEGLQSRDRAASAVRALSEWERLHGSLEGEPGQLKKAYLAALGKMDAALRARARWFIPLNARRRQEREVLDASERAGAWWFSARAECDDLVATWTARTQSLTPHLQACAECRADLAESGLVDAPPRRHLASDDLWRFDLGLMSEMERTRVERHTAKCADCARAVKALEDGDDAIDEALELEEEQQGARTTRTPEPRRPGARHPEQRQVLEERRDFRVVLVRERQRVRLVVQPLAGRAVTAAVFLTPGRPSLKPQQEAEGIAFDLTAAAASGARFAHLSIQAGTETLERDFTF
ncbi:hypothetical protein P2318_07345 [Myxococcaceae bacterium GXIMD 01537]